MNIEKPIFNENEKQKAKNVSVWSFNPWFFATTAKLRDFLISNKSSRSLKLLAVQAVHKKQTIINDIEHKFEKFSIFQNLENKDSSIQINELYPDLMKILTTRQK